MDKKTYPRWVGVLLGLLLNGSAHYLAGNKRAAIKWYFAISLTATAGVLILAIPGIFSFVISLFLFLIALVLWLYMLKQSYRPIPRIRILGWIAVIALNVLLSTIWRHGITLLVRPFKIPTEAMTPALISGDYVVAERLSYRFSKPKRGDIVVFSTRGMKYPAIQENTFYIKRIAGLPGETIQIDPPNLLINGQNQTTPASLASISKGSHGFTLVQSPISFPSALTTPNDKLILGQKEYFTIGDNTTKSLDGRYYGPISEDQVYGRITRIYWPLSRIRN